MGWSKHQPTGLVHRSPAGCYEGYTLFSAAGSRRSGNEGDVFATLVDMEGRVCHRWRCDEGIRYACLLTNGNLLVRTRPSPDLDGAEPMGGASGAILELDPCGDVVWEYRDPALHHDYVRLASGNTLLLLWERMPADLTARVRGGSVSEGDPPRMFGDVIRETTPGGLTVYEWRSWEHLSIEDDVICPLEGRREWTHANSLAVTASGDRLLSFRQTSTVAIVDKSTGDFRWKWGPGELSHQHDATPLDNGHVTIFDNGSHRGGPSYSRVVEVDPGTDEITWEYVGDPQTSFFSHNISSAERLPNGNTLIADGQAGRIFEVTPGCDMVWEYINPFSTGSTEDGFSNSIFRAHRYGPDYPGLLAMDLDPGRTEDLGGLYAGR